VAARLASPRPGRAVGPVVLLFIVNGLGNAVFTPFAPAILVERGVSATWLGVLGALVSLAYVALVGTWGHVADVVLGRPRALALALVLAAVLLTVFALPLPLAGVGLAYMAFATTYGLMFPLQDALAVNALANPAGQYGQLRALQSGAFAVGSLVAGALFERAGYMAAVPAFILLAVPSIGIALLIPDVGRARIAAERRGGAIREALAVEPRLPRVLVAIGLANVGVFATLTFLPLLVDRLGGASGDIGLAFGVTAAVEVGAMPVVSRLLARHGPRPVMAASIALLAVVFAWFALAPAPEHVIAAAALNGIGWSGMYVGSVTTIRLLLPPTLQGSGQSLLALTTGGVGALVANVGGGLLWSSSGPIAVFGLAAVCAAVGSAGAWWALTGVRDTRPDPEAVAA
jgi:PPP family 3-phenylpropionic acid transporter